MARKVKKYEVEFEGRKTKVTIPNEAEAIAYEALKNAIRENLTPEAVVGAAACMVGIDSIKDKGVRQQVQWFQNLLINTVGVEAYNRMLNEIGL